jgi:outer membrane protein assembly factor BamB
MVIVGSGDGRIYMIDLNKGEKIWSYEIGKPISSTPAVIKNMVVVGSEDGSIYAFGIK